MADPTDLGPLEPGPAGDIAPIRAPYLPWAFLPAPQDTPELPFFLRWPKPEPQPPPPPTPAVALAAEGTVSDAEGAAETYKDTPARALTNEEAKAVLLDLKSKGMLKWSPAKILYHQNMPDGGIVGTFKVRKKVPEGQPPSPLVDFAYAHGVTSDPRLSVLLHRLAMYLYSDHDVTGMAVGILRDAGRAELSCHNQGRAVDVFSVTWGSELLSVDECWGALPFRVNGEVVRKEWNKTTKEFDTGDPVLGLAAIKDLLESVGERGPKADKLRQERLNPDIEVDLAVYRSILVYRKENAQADPGPPEDWSADTRAKADALQVKLRKAATVFLGMFDFFVREATLQGSSAFAKEQVATLSQRPISRMNSGNMCIPDGSAWSAHLNHFHVQIGLTGWQEDVDSTVEQDPGQIDPAVKAFLYGRIAGVVIGRLKAFPAKHQKAATDGQAAFEKKKVAKKIPEDAQWADDRLGKKLERMAKIAAGAADESLIRRVEMLADPNETTRKARGVDRDPTVEATEDLILWQPRRGRVLTKWKNTLSDAGLDKKVSALEADASLSVEAARARLVEQIHADFDAWRDLGLKGK